MWLLTAHCWPMINRELPSGSWLKMSWHPIASPHNHPKTTQSSLFQTIFYKKHKGLSILKGFRYSYKHPLFMGENTLGWGGRGGMVHSTPTKIYMSEHEEPKPHVDRTIKIL
jgi:hypothetical protein